MKPPHAAPRRCDSLLVAAIAIEHRGYFDPADKLVLGEDFFGTQVRYDSGRIDPRKGS